jgi:hypothetical protein
MNIHVKCKCGKLFSATESMIGKRVKCPSCKQKVTVPDPRKVFANQVVHDQMQQTPASGPLSSVVNQVGKELDQLGEQISKLQGELAEVRKLLNSA